MTKYEKLKQALLEDGLTEAEASDLATLDEVLAKLPVPIVRHAHQSAMVKLLRQELPEAKSRWQQFLELFPIALLLSQVRVIQRELWAASAVVMGLGVMITLADADEVIFGFSVIAPMVAAASVAMLYDSDFRAMLEIEETSRASAWILLLARLTLIFSFNLTLAFIGSIVLAMVKSDIPLLPLILSWLAPMTFLSGLAFFLSIIGRNSLFAGGFSLVLWMGHLILTQMDSKVLLIQILSAPALSVPSYRPLVILAGILLIAASLWQVGIMERRVESR